MELQELINEFKTLSEKFGILEQEQQEKHLKLEKLHENDNLTLFEDRYVICDPCYIFDDEMWLDILDKTDHFTYPVYQFNDGTKLITFNTVYGDGCYYDNFGLEYYVDAGVIGIISLENFNKYSKDGIISTGMQLHGFDETFNCKRTETHLIFGEVEILIDDYDNNDDDDYEFEPDDDDYKFIKEDEE